MITRNFYEVEVKQSDPVWFHKRISDLSSLFKPRDFNFIDENISISEALQIMKLKSVDCLLVFNREK
jgi:hypothetical protein